MPPVIADTTEESILRNMIYTKPGDRELVARWEKLVGTSHGDRLGRLHSLQDNSPALVWSVVVALLQVNSLSDIRSRYADQIGGFLEAPEIQALARLWQAHADGRPIDMADAAAIRRVGGYNISLFFLIKTPSRSVVSVRHASKEIDALAQDIGLDPRCVQWVGEFLLKDEPWQNYLSNAEFPSPYASQTVSSLEDYSGFQERVIREKCFSFRDPLSGEICHCLDSWQIHGRTCYMFRGKELFYIMSGGSGSKAFCLYIPKFEIILDFRAGLEKLLSDVMMSNTLAGISSRLGRLAGKYNAAIQSPALHKKPKNIILAIQKTQNFAHHYWNFYTGLERLVLAGLADNVSRVQFSSTEFFGELAHLFPEFAAKVEILDKPPNFDPCPFSSDDMLVTVGGYAIPQTLLNRVRSAVTSLPPKEGAALPEDYPAAWPVVWIGMRLGDKSWVTQEQDIPVLVDRLLEKYPNILVVLDGFSFPVGVDQITHKWIGILDQLHQLAERIRLKCAMPNQVVSMIGNSLRESVLWAERTNVYLAPIGTTQHKIGWFTSAPGIVYMPDHGKDSVRRERMPGAWEAEGSALPEYLTGTAVAPGERRGVNDQRLHLDNVRLDMDLIFQKLLDLLHEPSR